MGSPSRDDPRPADPSLIELAGHPCAVHVPAEPLPGGCVILLGGSPERGGRGPVPATAVERAVWDGLVAAGLPVLAPSGGEAWWLERIVPSFDAGIAPAAIAAGPAVAEAARRFGVGPPGIALVGCGVGGQAALGIAYRRPDLFPVVAAVSPAVDFHLAMRDGCEGSEVLWDVFGEVERARQETAILHVHPLNWPRHQFFAADANDPVWYDGACRLHGKLAALGVPHEWLLDPVADVRGYPAAAAAAAVGFVVERLARESRRIA